MNRIRQKFSSPKRILHLLGFGTAVSLLGDATIYAVLPNPGIAAEAGVTLAMVGILLGANRAVRLLLNGPVGLLYDRLPRRGLLVSSLFIGVFSTLLYVLGFGFWPLFAGRIAWGLAWSLLWIGGNAVMLDISTPENRGRHSGLYQMWFMIGVAFSALLGGLFTDWLGFRGGLALSAGLIAVAATVWLFALPETRRVEAVKVEDEEEKSGLAFPWGAVLVTALPVFAARFVTWGVLAATAILWLEGLFGQGLTLGGLVIPLATLTGLYTALTMPVSIIAAPTAGTISDRIGRRWPVIAFAVIIGGLGIWWMSSPLLALALTGAALAQAVGGGVEALIPAAAGDRVAEGLRGRALGLIYTIGDLGAALGPPAALGLLDMERLGLPVIYRFSAGLLFLVALVSWGQARREKTSQTPDM
jgi:MFS family permease